ncbi:MAG TPA: hypothetical protein ENI85_00545 [Deltaproteobacteria bacterium]|nr:hypothetical protein [Deltaproteobacteria bacterium]
MSASAVFELACEVLEAESDLSRLEARGTIRLALKKAGLEAHAIDRDQMCVVTEKILPEELVARGIEPRAVLPTLVRRLRSLTGDTSKRVSPESIFRKLAGDA